MEAHFIGRLSVEAAIPDLDTALALRPRLEALCWEVMPRVFERVCDSAVPKDLHLEIDRLELDLGRLRPDRLEEDALAALEEVFAEALTKALRAAGQVPSAEGRLMSSSEARSRRLEDYLSQGVANFAGGAERFDPRTELLLLAEEAPEALVELLRRNAHDLVVLERVVLQLGEEGLARLLSLLAPADAALILALLADVIAVHRDDRAALPARLSESGLQVLVWTTTLEFLLRDPGTQFNRRRFLAFLLERESRRLGIDYHALLRLLMAAAERLSRRSPLRSSLPRILAELLQETDLAGRSLSAVLSAARRHAGDPVALDRLFSFSRPELPGALLRQLVPDHAAAIEADLDELAALHDAVSLLPSDAAAFRRRLRLACLAYLLDPQRGSFRTRLLWRAIVAGLARFAGISAPQMVDRLRRAHAGRKASYPRVTAALDGMARFVLPDRASPWAGAEDPLAAALHRGTLAREDVVRLLAAASPEVLRELAARLRASGAVAAAAAVDDMSSSADPLSLVRRFLLGGRPRRAGALLPELAEHEPDSLADLIRTVACEAPDSLEALARRLLDWLLPGELAALLGGGADAWPAAPGSRIGIEAALPLAVALLRGHSLPVAPVPEIPPKTDLAALFAWLDGIGGGRDDDELARQFALLADRRDPALRDYLAARRSSAPARARWARILPPQGLERLAGLMAPPGFPGLAAAVELIAGAWRAIAPFGARRPERHMLWAVALDRIATVHPIDPARVLESLMDSLAGGDAALKARLAGRAGRLARDGGQTSLRAALRRTRAAKTPPPRPPAARTSWPHPAARVAPDAPIFIGNAGLVLFHPFLPLLFERLNLLDGAERTAGVGQPSRAVHLLQYLADGRLDAPEPELALNKVLCGYPPSWPVERSLTPSAEDIALCDGLIAAVLEQWSPLRDGDAAMLRETFLQREGRLRRSDTKWLLDLQRKTVDVLLGQLPWGVSVIYHPWMKDPLHVTW